MILMQTNALVDLSSASREERVVQTDEGMQVPYSEMRNHPTRKPLLVPAMLCNHAVAAPCIFLAHTTWMNPRPCMHACSTLRFCSRRGANFLSSGSGRRRRLHANIQPFCPARLATLFLFSHCPLMFPHKADSLARKGHGQGQCLPLFSPLVLQRARAGRLNGPSL